MGTKDLMTEAMLATSPLERAPALQPVDALWAFPVRTFFNRFRRRSPDGIPLFFTDGLSPKDDRAFRRRHPGLSLVFAYYTLGHETVALIWHPRYEVVHAIGGLVRRAAAINPNYDALPTERQVKEIAGAERAAERLDYALALRAFDREAAAIWRRGRSYLTWLREQIDRLAIANGDAWLRRQLEGLDGGKR
jgi:hypothetical protein